MHTTPRYSPIPMREAGPIWWPTRREGLVTKAANYLSYLFAAGALICVVVGLTHALGILSH